MDIALPWWGLALACFLSLLVGGIVTLAVLLYRDLQEFPESAVDGADGDDIARIRDTEAANAAYERGKTDGIAIERAEQRAKKRAAGLQAAATRKRRDTIIGSEG